MRGRRITEETFNAVKMLNNQGIGASAICKALSLGNSTVYQMLKADSYAHYRAIKQDEQQRYQDKCASTSETMELNATERLLQDILHELRVLNSR